MVYPKKWKCPNCSQLVDSNKLCPNCKFRFGNHYPKLWSCPSCNNINSDSEFCKICDYPNNLSFPKLWHCHECSNLIKDAQKCDVCGFEFKEKKPEKVPIIEKKIVKKDFLDKKNIYLMSIGVIVLSLILVFYSMDFSTNEEFVVDLLAGNSFSKDFLLASNLDSVTFELQSPTGEILSVSGEKKSNNIWRINNISLNESGTWNVKIVGIVGLSSFESTDSLEIKDSCINSSNCISGVCCNGACINVCSNSSDCDDYNSLTTDVCLNPNSCLASCINSGLTCNTISRDGYCPSECNKYNDVDCVSCASGEAVCDNVCKKIECKTNVNCDDSNPSTIDKCIIMNDQCDNYCENNFYEGSCAIDKVEYNGYCITPSCVSANDCKKVGWNYNCINAGTIDAYCSYSKCNSGEILCLSDGINKCTIPACKRNSDCLTNQICENAWECNAKCVVSSNNIIPISCSDNQYFCGNLCKNYENLCSWPSTPIDSNICNCNESSSYLFKKSESFNIDQFLVNSNSSVNSLSMLCSSCNSKTGNCFEGKNVKITYTIDYNGDSVVSVPLIGLSKSYDHVAQSNPPQFETKNDYFMGVINCNSNSNLTLSSELSATLYNVKIFVESKEIIESTLVNVGYDYTSSVCPGFDNSEYIINFDIDLVIGNFSMNYGLDKSNKNIIFNETQSNVISRGIIDCSLTNNDLMFIPSGDVFHTFTVSNVKLFVKGCNNDFDCASNEFDKCSISKCVNNKCQTSRINTNYCNLNKSETLINFVFDGTNYLNESICLNSLNDGMYYLINAQKQSAFSEDLTISYGADSKKTSVTINSPERIIISGQINCSNPEKKVLVNQALDSFSMYIKDYKHPIVDQTSPADQTTDPVDTTPVTPPTCNWPTTLDVENNVCNMVVNDSNNLIMDLSSMSTFYNLFGDKQTSDSQLLNYLCDVSNSYDGKQFYLNYFINYNGKVNVNSGVLNFIKTYTSTWPTNKNDEVSGTIKCSNYKELMLKNDNYFPSSSSKFSNGILYVKKI
jgi:hypothetical protein